LDDAKPVCVITNLDDLHIFPTDAKIFDFEFLLNTSLGVDEGNLRTEELMSGKAERIFAVMYTSGNC
jgi:hypothetical protein